MYTKNGLNALSIGFINDYNSYASRYFKNIDGETWYLSSSVASNLFQMTQNLRIVVGAGNTAPTTDDYILEDEITTGLTVVATGNSKGRQYFAYDDYYIAYASATFRNDSDADIVVREVGIYTKPQSYSEDNTILVAREVLSSPVTIHPQESYSFTLTIG